VSASGAKYADVSYTLHTKGDEAFLEQDGAITRRTCLAKPPE
jgi:membrane-bound inhibitor of C-type lysozyme